MKNIQNQLLTLLLILLFFGCKTSQKTTILASSDDNLIRFNFLQINDVYEIAPLESGKVGGLARA